MGSAGISLSGGQKQRLALARAVYSRKELVMLDDVFSGLDAETEEHIFNSLFGKKGLFRQMRTTVILVTHGVHRLSYSDQVIALSGQGRILEQGCFEDLKNSDGYVQSLAAKLKSENISKTTGTVPKPTNLLAKVDGEEEINVITEELNRQTGDFAVYKYYFASIGWLITTIFFVFVVLFGIASKMTEFLLTYVCISCFLYSISKKFARHEVLRS